MKFYPVSDLTDNSQKIWGDISENKDVILTKDGKPSALVVNIPDGCFDEVTQAIRQARAMIALNNMRRKAAKAGYMTDEEIESAINQARNER